MSDFLTQLRSLEAKATPGKWAAPSANGFRLYAWKRVSREIGEKPAVISYEPYRCIINNAFSSANWGMEAVEWPKTDEASQEAWANVEIIAFLRNHARAIAALVEAVRKCHPGPLYDGCEVCRALRALEDNHA